MTNHNWLITDDGQPTTFGSTDNVQPPKRVYRLYRFLTDLEDILADEKDDSIRIQKIVPLVRKLLTSSYWLQMEYDAPSPKTGWSVKFLYREYEFPLTVQMVAWAPGQVSTIHNHSAWGIVALIGGEEKNHLWQRSPTEDKPHRLESAGEIDLVPGDIIGFTPGAIHQVQPIGDEPTVSFNLYGVTDYKTRYEYDVKAQTAKLF
ncbi:cupin [Leptolyngbyaceae cyanobacterium CCMR0082]|uniref:Cupin n=2 Tax=Adonisia turfae TaxID=2950184 RepID=A0A6M0S6V0_9CYAN|nr:cupin [Adonisia turfae]MDV3351056.1 cupin [Leptothoe sp. LEGE 181152]NEZ57407.1 cupin [Adonisia turfae CCMR0081]NEZ64207.1 cupin [Adonisia turfae CCMR0082]